MKHRIYRFFLLVGLVVLSAFTLVPPAHQIPESHKYVPEMVAEKPPVDSLLLLTGSGEAKQGEQVCIPITAHDFENILSVQFSLNWDTTVLKFSHIENFGMRDMSNNNFGHTMTEDGILTFMWYDQHLLGKSRPDGFKLYDVCFEVVGEPGTETSVEITGKPTVVEIVDANANFLALRTELGVVQVEEE